MTKRKQKAKSNTEKAARAFGYRGPMSQLAKYKKSDPVFARKMAMVQDKLNMRKGGVVKLSGGSYLNATGTNYANQNTTTPVEKKDPAMGQFDAPIISPTSSTTAEDLGLGTQPIKSETSPYTGSIQDTFNESKQYYENTNPEIQPEVAPEPEVQTKTETEVEANDTTLKKTAQDLGSEKTDNSEFLKYRKTQNILALGQKYLGRDFLQKGLDYYLNPDENYTMEQIEDKIMASPEAKVQTLGQKYLGRFLIPNNLRYYLDPTKDYTDEDIENMIATSPEAKVQAFAQKYLGRFLTPENAKPYYDSNKDYTDAEIEEMISTSPEAIKYKESLATGEGIEDKGIKNSETDPNEFPDAPTYDPVEVSKIGDTTENQKVKFDKIEDADVKTLTDPRDLVTETVAAPTTKDAIKTTATTTEADVEKEIDTLTAEQGTVSDKAQVSAITKDPLTSEVKNIKASELDSPRVIKDTTRTLEDDELVSGPSVDQARVETDVIAKTKAAQLDLDPAATVKYQLSTLYQDFTPSNPPAWADGAVRTAMATLNARGMGASSLAGQAVVQAVMESALPIAQADAKTVFDLGLQNLSNRQATVILAAQQRAAFLGQEFDQAFQTKVANAAKISDIANQNFTAETQIAIENAKLAQTVDLANLSNRQAVIMANAAQIANLEVTNLNNRQAAEVQNAQSFLQMDIANLNNRQKTNLFKTEAMIQSLFTDAAAQNVAAQFNAESENQVNRFYDQLATQVKEFNATQTNSANKFNIQSELAVDEFNAQTRNAVQQFNASNGLVISQANAEWERNKATVDTAAQNQANQFDAQMEMQITIREFEGLVQEYRDIMSFAQESSENLLDRETQLGIATINKQSMIESAKFAMSGELYKAFGTLGAQMMGNTDVLGKAFDFLGSMFGDKNTGTGGTGTGNSGTNIIETPEQRDDRIVELDTYGDVAGDDARVGYVPPEDTPDDVLPETTSDYSTFGTDKDPASTS